MAKGPAPKGEYVGKSSVFSTRIRPDLKKKLGQAAQRSGRSLSQEVEHRLNRSFVEDEKIAETFGDRRTFILMRMMADAIQLADADQFGNSSVHWTVDPLKFETMVSAALGILEAFWPEGDIPPDALPKRHYQVAGHRAAYNIWRKIKRADPALPLDRGTNDDHKRRMMKDGLAGLADRALENDPSPTKD